MLKLLGALAGMMSSLSSNAPQDRARQPIQLVAEPVDEGVRVRVVGSSHSPYAASFVLEVNGGGNRSVHNGSVNLSGGDTVTLSTVTLGNLAPGHWRAHLRVEPQAGQGYEQTRTSF